MNETLLIIGPFVFAIVGFLTHYFITRRQIASWVQVRLSDGGGSVSLDSRHPEVMWAISILTLLMLIFVMVFVSIERGEQRRHELRMEAGVEGGELLREEMIKLLTPPK